MKKSILSLMVALTWQWTLLASGQVVQQEVPHVSVSGTAVAETVPDIMAWRLQVRSINEKVEDAAAEHSKAVAGLLVFLKDAGVDAKVIQTSQMEFGENWEFDEGKRHQKGYFANTIVTFKLTSLALYEKLWTGLSKQGGVSVLNVGFDCTNRIALQNEVRQKALLSARDKAKLLANTLNCSIGDPLEIEDQSGQEDFESSANPANSVRYSYSPAGANQDGAVSPGTIPIKTTVRASFRLTAGMR